MKLKPSKVIYSLTAPFAEYNHSNPNKWFKAFLKYAAIFTAGLWIAKELL